MSDPALGLTMLTPVVVVIMLGFPTAFTLMGLGIMFGFVAFYDPSQPWTQNKTFDLIEQRVADLVLMGVIGVQADAQGRLPTSAPRSVTYPISTNSGARCSTASSSPSAAFLLRSPSRR